MQMKTNANVNGQKNKEKRDNRSCYDQSILHESH